MPVFKKSDKLYAVWKQTLCYRTAIFIYFRWNVANFAASAQMQAESLNQKLM